MNNLTHVWQLWAEIESEYGQDMLTSSDVYLTRKHAQTVLLSWLKDLLSNYGNELHQAGIIDLHIVIEPKDEPEQDST
jgi:hypothetical protein